VPPEVKTIRRSEVPTSRATAARASSIRRLTACPGWWTLEGLAQSVSSASRRTVHSEQMFSLEGSLRLGRSSRDHEQVENRSGLNLRDVVVVRRSFRRGEPQYQGTWIGELRNNDSALLGLTSLAMDEPSIPYADKRQQAARQAVGERFVIDPLLKVAFQFPTENDPFYGKRDEYRLVGVVDEVLPGAESTPSASQIRGDTVVLAHLQYGPSSEPRPDVNSRTDVIKDRSAAIDGIE